MTAAPKFLALATDFDGTIAQHGDVTQSTQQALERWRMQKEAQIEAMMRDGLPLGAVAAALASPETAERIALMEAATGGQHWKILLTSGMGFFTEASGNLADDKELCELMVRAGFKKVFVGIETPSVESLQECHKVQNKGRDLVETVKTLQRAGLQFEILVSA